LALASDAVLQQFYTFDGVPEQLWKEAISESDADRVEALQHEYRKKCAGYTPGRQPVPPASGDQAQAAAPFSTGANQEVDGTGCVSVEMEVSTVPEVDFCRETAMAAARRMESEQKPGGVLLASAEGRGLLSTYDKDFAARLHPWVFPNATGGRPGNMAMANYAAILLRRWPREQFAEDNLLALDLNNIVQRQDVNQGVRIYAKWQGHGFEQAGDSGPHDVRAALTFLQQGLRGQRRQQGLQDLPPKARKIADAFRTVGGKIRGTPASYSRLRSEFMALWHMFGPFTCSINLNPSELHSGLSMTLAGHEYTYTASGAPATGAGGRPNNNSVARLLAANPTACAQFFHAFITAFIGSFLGFGPGEGKQRPGRWLFGRVLAYGFKPETGGRGGLHAHGPIIQPQLQAAQLQQYLSTPAGEQYVLKMLGGMICQALPTPDPERWDAQYGQTGDASDVMSSLLA
jgi:hypothetical protein